MKRETVLLLLLNFFTSTINLTIMSHNKCTSAQRENLISEVQLRPVLWNDRLKEYKNSEKIKKIWAEVGAICGLTGK